MFNIGGDDKEKLEENMEEIKNLVSKDQNNQNQGQNEAKENEDSLDERNESNRSQDFDENMSEDFSKENNAVEEADPQLNDFDGEQNTDTGQVQKENNLSSPQETGGTPKNPVNGTPQTDQQTKNQKSYMSSQNGNNQPQQPQNVQELQNEIKDQINTLEKESRRQEDTSSQNQSEEEPLFLEVERFEDIRDMVEEMHYLTTEMDDVMESLAAGIQQDQETAGEANQIVSEFQARRDKIEQILREN